jgi:hypothetical protein
LFRRREPRRDADGPLDYNDRQQPRFPRERGLRVLGAEELIIEEKQDCGKLAIHPSNVGRSKCLLDDAWVRQVGCLPPWDGLLVMLPKRGGGMVIDRVGE